MAEPRSTRYPKLRPSGFSLLEMLVAMTILAIVCTLLFSGFHIITRAWRKEQVRTEEGERIRSVCELIRRQVSCCFPAVPKEDPNAPKPQVTADQPQSRFMGHRIPFFQGSSNRMTFVSLYSLHLSRLPGLCLITYAFESSRKGSGMELVEYETQYTCEDPEFGPTAVAGGGVRDEDKLRRVLLENLDEASFEYFGADLNDVGVKAEEEIRQEWRSEWNSKRMGTLPDAVRIKYRQTSRIPSLRGEGEFLMQIRSRGNIIYPVQRRFTGVPM